MKSIRFNLFLFLFILLLSACEKTLVGPVAPNNSEENFEKLWQEYDRLYGSFRVKNINWDALYAQYRPLVKPTTSDAELMTIMTNLLRPLDDNHVFLRPLRSTGLKPFNGGLLGRQKFEDYDKAVAQAYLTDKKTYGNAIIYGKLRPDIGYINLLHFDNNFNFYTKALDDILNELEATKGIVVEMRENDGGEDRVSQYIANRFASEKHLSFTSRLRNGPKHSDFAAPLKFYTEPAGHYQFTKPVVVLTRRAVFSAGETFVLAMKQNKNVTLVGDSTGGGIPDAMRRELPNGWVFRVPIADVRGPKGESYEGIGIAPDVLIKNKKTDLAAGKDEALETAISLID
ncbi:S41 family peptidase [Adhaeribacter pallidiroseus]|uniref:C-terminal processing peptidase n=1 Tax=Adhaeribacter pallidiroseus TaxID=2072847 RepID=A0A369QKP0_9BACT|nr:S41 family peptidase [Adhaeribacter pallidiroseus]RDC63786.1 C-terminal processing peptidase [Adhaeribacter pallidiroseus]